MERPNLGFHSSVDRHSGFILFGYYDNAAMNICVQVLCVDMFSFLLGMYLGVELSDCKPFLRILSVSVTHER